MKILKPTLVLFLAFLSLNVSADIVTVNTHYVEKCTRITNVNDFPELVLVGVIFDWAILENRLEMDLGNCIDMGYKDNILTIRGVNSAYLLDKSMEDINVHDDPHFLDASIAINAHGFYYHDTIPISSVNEYYKIMGFTEETIVLHKWKEEFGFNNGNSDSVVYYDYAGDTVGLYQEIPLGINDYKERLGLSVYPNPVHGELNINTENNYTGSVAIAIFSMTGQLVQTESREKTRYSEKLQFDINDLPKGVYFMELGFGEFKESMKIMVE